MNFRKMKAQPKARVALALLFCKIVACFGLRVLSTPENSDLVRDLPFEIAPTWSPSPRRDLGLGSRQKGHSEVKIDMDDQRPISSTLYGIFFAEINHAGDGGLYAELVQDRSFEATAAAAGFQRLGQSGPSKFKVDLSSLMAFHRGPMEPISYLADEKQNQGLNFTGQSRRPPYKKAVEEGNAIIIPWVALAGTSTTLTREVPLNAGNPVAMELSVDQPGEQGEGRRGGVANFGYWGVHVEKGKSYTYSLYVRNPQDDAVEMEVSLSSADFGQRYASASFSARPGGAWNRYSGELTTDVADTDARILVTFEGPGTVIIDSVSLFATENVEKGKRLGHVNPWPFRADLLQALKDLRPGFLRFPGGCYVEGDWMRNSFMWKKSIGSNEERPGHYDLWGYWSTDGLGLFEYMLLSEELETEPIWVLNNGVAHGDSIPTGKVLPLLQDALDSLEFIMGPANSTWGSVRAAMGRDEPWKLKYVAIGNEDCGKPYYTNNYNLFFGAFKAAYPHLQLISNCDMGNDAPTDLWDWHVYTNPTNMFNLRTAFDGRDPGAGHLVFASEYAVTDGGGWGNLIGAVAEAAFMTGLERNGAAVPLAAYAPLFVNWNDRTWPTNLIVFDNHRWFGIPSYHVQRLFREVQGVAYVSTIVERGAETTLAASTTCLNYDCDSLAIKLVNFSPGSLLVDIEVEGQGGGMKIRSDGDGLVISSSAPNDENSFENPLKVSPSALKLRGLSHSFALELDPWSINILRVHVGMEPSFAKEY